MEKTEREKRLESLDSQMNNSFGLSLTIMYRGEPLFLELAYLENVKINDYKFKDGLFLINREKGLITSEPVYSGGLSGFGVNGWSGAFRPIPEDAKILTKTPLEAWELVYDMERRKLEEYYPEKVSNPYI